MILAVNTLVCGSVWSLNPGPNSAQKSGALPTEPTERRLEDKSLIFLLKKLSITNFLLDIFSQHILLFSFKLEWFSKERCKAEIKLITTDANTSLEK